MGKRRGRGHSGRLAVILSMAGAVRNEVIAFTNRLASAVGSRYEWAVRNGTALQHAQVVGRLVVIIFCPRSQGPLETESYAKIVWQSWCVPETNGPLETEPSESTGTLVVD